MNQFNINLMNLVPNMVAYAQEAEVTPAIGSIDAANLPTQITPGANPLEGVTTDHMKKGVTNPGPFESAYYPARSLLELPSYSSNMWLEHSNSWSNGFTLSHRCVWGSGFINRAGEKPLANVPYYRISGRYKNNNSYLWGAIRSTKEVDIVLAHNWGSALQTSLRAQIDSVNSNMFIKYHADAHFRTNSGCYSLKVMNKGLSKPTVGRRALYGFSFLQGVSDRISLGGEFIAIEAKNKKQKAKNGADASTTTSSVTTFPLHSTLALRLNDPKYFAMLSYSNTATKLNQLFKKDKSSKSGPNVSRNLFFLHYLHRVTPNTSLGCELGVDATSLTCMYKAGYQFDLPKAETVIRGTVDQTMTVTSSVETALSPRYKMSLSAGLNYTKNLFQFGVKFQSNGEKKQKGTWTPQLFYRGCLLTRRDEGSY